VNYGNANLNEDMIFAVVIAILAIATGPEKNFGNSTAFELLASALPLQCSTN